VFGTHFHDLLFGPGAARLRHEELQRDHVPWTASQQADVAEEARQSSIRLLTSRTPQVKATTATDLRQHFASMPAVVPRKLNFNLTAEDHKKLVKHPMHIQARTSQNKENVAVLTATVPVFQKPVRHQLSDVVLHDCGIHYRSLHVKTGPLATGHIDVFLTSHRCRCTLTGAETAEYNRLVHASSKTEILSDKADFLLQALDLCDDDVNLQSNLQILQAVL
jgi:hypothetical protein